MAAQERPSANVSGAGESDRRAAARLPQDALLRCSLGQICDLSLTGMRIRCRRLPTSSLLRVQVSDGRTVLNLRAEVVWVNKLGFRKYEIGLQFLEVPPDVRKAISGMAMYNRFSRSM